MKVAFDENIPLGMVRVFQSLASERQIRRVTGSIVVKSAADYTPKVADRDYRRSSDVPWIHRFAKDAGKAVISGDVRMRSDPHERLALRQSGVVAIFFEASWAEWNFFRKSALLLNWWPVIAEKLVTAKPGTFWVIPSKWKVDCDLKDVSLGQQEMFKENPNLTVRPSKIRKRKRTLAATGADDRQAAFLEALDSHLS